MNETPRTDDLEVELTMGLAPQDKFIAQVLDFARQLERELAEANNKIKLWALGVEQSNTDIVDMHRDEFKRIKALFYPSRNSLAAEVVGICDRAIACIEQAFPVVVQRDNFESDRDRWRKMAEELFTLIKAMDDDLMHNLPEYERLEGVTEALSRFNAMKGETK